MLNEEEYYLLNIEVSFSYLKEIHSDFLNVIREVNVNNIT